MYIRHVVLLLDSYSTYTQARPDECWHSALHVYLDLCCCHFWVRFGTSLCTVKNIGVFLAPQTLDVCDECVKTRHCLFLL